MNFIFQQQLNDVLLRSEKKRTTILLAIFLFGICYQLVDIFILKNADGMGRKIYSFKLIWLFPVTLTIFELLSLLFINIRIRSNKKHIPIILQFLNITFEICFPTFIMAFVAKHYPSINVLQSPVIFVYFIFIILSTLRLNFALSFYCGSLASLAYVFSCVFNYNRFTSDDGIKAFAILLCGLAAGFVAKQIRSGINYSMKESEKRQRVENLFGRQLSMEVAEKMLENDGKVESKRMNVAIMFIDIRNFTDFAAQRSPEEIVQYQNAFFSVVINTISRHQGVIHQFLGDGCMVTFGAPVALENPSRNAVDAALELLSAIRIAVREGNLVSTRIGIGIHKGDVITGNIGTNERQQYSITGNVVIMASRIEELNKQFDSQLLVSEDVVESINQDRIPSTNCGAVVLKGWNIPITVFQLV